MINTMGKAMPKWEEIIRNSFISEELKTRYMELMLSRLDRIIG